MPELITGYNTEQKVVTVANNDSAINAQLTTEATDDWIATLFTVSGSDVIILFSRNVVIEAP